MFTLARLSVVAMLIVVTCVVVSAQSASAPAAAIFFDKAKVDQAMTSGSVLHDGKMFRVQMGKRSEAGQVEFHAKDTDVFYIVSGSATFVTGGTMVGGKTTGPGEIRGTSITGGETRKLAKGDVIVIPDSVNHWWKEIQEPVIYFVVKEVTGK
jgi:mannose-6-phosphate isomerase-like protein (cupin superfamily)